MRIAAPGALAALLLLVASTADAQDVELPDTVLIFLNQANTADADQQQTALLEIGNVLRERGIAFEVEDDATCTGTSDGCLRLAHEEERADAVLILSVYHRGAEGSVDLQVFDGAMSGEGTQSWVGDPAAAAGQAMRTALESFRPETVAVTLTGTPESATVWLGRRTGHLPLIATITPGEHRLRVSADGYATHTETVNIPATDTEWNHEVRLERSTDPEPVRNEDPNDTSEPGSSRGALVGLGVTAMVAGAATAVVGGVLLARDGECVEDGCVATGTVVEEHDTGGAGVGLLIAGGALALIGGTLLIIGATRVDASAGPGGAHLRLTTQF